MHLPCRVQNEPHASSFLYWKINCFEIPASARFNHTEDFLNLCSGSTTKLWTHFCWKMGPLLLHNKNIIVVDKTLREVARMRYDTDIKEAHKTLYDYFEKQPNCYTDKKGKDRRYGG